MRLRTLGGLALEGAELSRPKPLLLLAFLALEGPQQRRHLAELFWPRAAQRMRNLRVALTQLRSGAPSAIEAEGAVLAARVGSDAAELRAAFEGDPLRAARLYRGRFLDGFDPEHVDAELEEWVYATRERLAGCARHALLKLATGEAASDRFEAAVRWAEAAYDLPGAAPLEGHEAERLYDVLVAGDSPRTAEVRRELAELGLRVERTSARARSALRTAPDRVAPSNLPARAPDLVGRDHEIERIGELLDGEASLLTLVGPPGIGKTSLASAVASGCRERGGFPDGVFVVWLAPVADAALVPATIAQAVGVPEDPLRPALVALQQHLRARNLLLVLDNVEHVADAASDVAALLAACPGVKVLATSRLALRVGAEVAFAVPPLAPPEAGGDEAQAAASPAVELFVRRARSADASFDLDDRAARAVAAICRRLEGLPLAIELAAARIRMFSPEALLERLDQRLDVLKGGARDRPERHRTLRQAIAWSYQLLGTAERALFRRLSAFAGGFSLASAEALADAADGSGVAPLDGIAALIEASLLQHVGDRDAGPRYAMLETLRAFGLERLEAEGELHEVRRAHAVHFVTLAERAAAQLTGEEQAAWLDALEAEHDDLRLAFAWAVEHDPSGLGLRLAASLWRFWIVRGYMHEGRERMEVLLEQTDQRASATRARALLGLGTILHELADMTGAERRLRESLRIHRQIGDRPGELTVLNNLSWMAVLAGDFPGAWSLAEDALNLAQRLEDRRGEALALNNMGWTAAYRGDLMHARSLYRRSLELRNQEGDRRGAAYALTNLASVETECGRLAEAGELLEQALAILRELADRQLIAWALIHRGALTRAEGRPREAVAMLDESVAAWREVGNPTGLAIALYTFAGVLSELGRWDEAERLLREDVPLWRLRAGAHRNPWCAAQRAWGLARVARARGDADGARAHLAAALETFEAIGARRTAAACTAELADLRAGAPPPR